MADLTLSKKLAEEIIAHAKAEAPNECCGVLAGTGAAVRAAYRAKNTERSPVKYNFDGPELLRIEDEAAKAGHDVLGFYHSHTFSEAYPSPTDVKLSSPWGYIYMIVSLRNPQQPAIRIFRIDRALPEGAQIQELSLSIV
ncbi:MAG: M67 family metallopeptidase [Chloroflexi bacterium]|nr:M67 family metallopeptidase [Chloroflexota bacterium]